MTFASNLHIIRNSLRNSQNWIWIECFWNVIVSLTIRPTWLLCKFIFDWISPAFSDESKKSSENSTPKFMLWEHPPHFHRLAAFNLEWNRKKHKIKKVGLLKWNLSYSKWKLYDFISHRGILLEAIFWFESTMRLSMVWKKCCLSSSKYFRNDFVEPLRFTYGSHPHEIKRPWLQALAMLCATPAAEMADANAASL